MASLLTDQSVCVAYFQPANITSSGGLVTGWTDSSGNGNDLSQGTSGNRPSDVTGLRGRAVYFPPGPAPTQGGTKALEFPVGLTLTSRNFTFFVVGEYCEKFSSQITLRTNSGTASNPLTYTRLSPTSSVGKAGFNWNAAAANFPKPLASTKQIVGTRCSAAATAHGYENATASALSVNVSNITGATMMLGNYSGLDAGLNSCFIYGAALFNRALTDAEATAVINDLIAEHSVNTTWANNIVFAGDSRVVGTGASNGYSFPYQSRYAVGNRYTNAGLGGQTVATANTNYANDIGLLYDSSFARNIVTAPSIANDMINGGASPDAATAWTNWTAWCVKARASGYQVVGMTECDYAASQAQYQTAMDAAKATFNANMIASGTTYAHAIARFDLDSRLMNRLNSTYFNDATHQNATGYAVMASIVDAAIDSLFITYRPRRRRRYRAVYPNRCN